MKIEYKWTDRNNEDFRRFYLKTEEFYSSIVGGLKNREEFVPYCLKGHNFFPYAKGDIYWESFEANDLIQFANKAGMEVILCEKGKIYIPEDGTVLHCLCSKRVW